MFHKTFSQTPGCRSEYKFKNLFLMFHKTAHGVGRVVGALGSEAGFAGSMLNKVISMMHVLHYHKNPKLQLSSMK